MHFTHIAEFISFTLHDSSFRSHHIIHFTHITEFINEDPVSDKAPHGDNSSIPHHAQAAYCVSCMHLSELETERGQVPVFAAWPLGPAKYVCIDQVFHMAFLISNTVPGIFFLFLWGREKLLKTNRPRNKLKIWQWRFVILKASHSQMKYFGPYSFSTGQHFLTFTRIVYNLLSDGNIEKIWTKFIDNHD